MDVVFPIKIAERQRVIQIGVVVDTPSFKKGPIYYPVGFISEICLNLNNEEILIQNSITEQEGKPCFHVIVGSTVIFSAPTPNLAYKQLFNHYNCSRSYFATEFFGLNNDIVINLIMNQLQQKSQKKLSNAIFTKEIGKYTLSIAAEQNARIYDALLRIIIEQNMQFFTPNIGADIRSIQPSLLIRFFHWLSMARPRYFQNILSILLKTFQFKIEAIAKSPLISSATDSEYIYDVLFESEDHNFNLRNFIDHVLLPNNTTAFFEIYKQFQDQRIINFKNTALQFNILEMATLFECYPIIEEMYRLEIPISPMQAMLLLYSPNPFISELSKSVQCNCLYDDLMFIIAFSANISVLKQMDIHILCNYLVRTGSIGQIVRLIENDTISTRMHVLMFYIAQANIKYLFTIFNCMPIIRQNEISKDFMLQIFTLDFSFKDSFARYYDEIVYDQISKKIYVHGQPQDNSYSPFTIDGRTIVFRYRYQELRANHSKLQLMLQNSKGETNSLFTKHEFFEFLKSTSYIFTFHNNAKINEKSLLLYLDSFNKDMVIEISSGDYLNYEIFLIDVISEFDYSRTSNIHTLKILSSLPKNDDLARKLKSKIQWKSTFSKIAIENLGIFPKIVEQSNELWNSISNIPGRTYIEYTDDESYELTVKKRRFKSLVLILEETGNFIKQSNLVQLDATFPLKNYILIIPRAIFLMRGYGISLYIGRSETGAAYARWFECMCDYFADKDMKTYLFQMRYMSDLGTGVQKFLRVYELHYWICIKHFLGTIGNDCLLHTYATIVLLSRTRSLFITRYNAFDPHVRKMREAKEISEAQFQKWKDIWLHYDVLALYVRDPPVSTNNSTEGKHRHYNTFMKLANYNKSEFIKLVGEDLVKCLNESLMPSNTNAKREFKRMLMSYVDDKNPENVAIFEYIEKWNVAESSVIECPYCAGRKNHFGTTTGCQYCSKYYINEPVGIISPAAVEFMQMREGANELVEWSFNDPRFVEQTEEKRTEARDIPPIKNFDDEFDLRISLVASVIKVHFKLNQIQEALALLSSATLYVAENNEKNLHSFVVDQKDPSKWMEKHWKMFTNLMKTSEFKNLMKKFK